jgi:hypothetical protein
MLVKSSITSKLFASVFTFLLFAMLVPEAVQAQCSTPAPTVVSPITYCQNATAAQLTATGSNLTWGTLTTGAAGGTTALTTTTFVDNNFSNQRTNFTTTTANVTITSVDYYIPAFQAVTGLRMAIFNSGGTVIATSSTITTQTATGTAIKITNVFNFKIAAAGSYSVGITAGTGNAGGSNPTYPITETTGTINVTGHTGTYRCYNNIQFTRGGSTTAPTPSTTTVGTTNYLVSQTINGCVSPTATIAVTVSASPSISQIPVTSLIGNYKFEGNANDAAGVNPGTLQNSPAQAADRFNVSNKAYSFNGTSNYVTTTNAYNNPNDFTISIWFKTAVAGGRLIGFGTSQTGLSGQYDRHIYMNNTGQLYFGVYPGSTVTVNSALSYNDDKWHQATATLSSTAGMALYVDGVQVGSNPNNKAAENYTGYWRIGWDNNNSWNSQPSNYYFSGALDDALIYTRALSASEVATTFNSPDGAGNNGPVCNGSTLSLSATTVASATYAWTGPNSFTSSLQNPTRSFSAANAGIYTLQVTAGGCTTTAYTTVATSSAVGQWTGVVSTDWANASNWCSGTLPTSATNVTISSTATRMPTISGAASCNSLTIDAGATLTATIAGTLNIAGTLTNNGTYTNSGTTNFNGTSGQQTFSGVSQFYNLTLNNTAGLLLPAAVTISNNLTLTAGTLTANNFNVVVRGNWVNNASAAAFAGGTATVTFSGTAAQTISGSAVTTFNNLTISNTGTAVTSNINSVVAGNLSVTTGTFDIGTYTVNRSAAGGILTVANAATLKIGGTNTYPANYTTNTLSVASTVAYAGTNQAVSNQAYGNLTLSSSAGAAVKTFPAMSLSIVGSLTTDIGSGTSTSFTAASNITVNGNITLGASTTFDGGVFSHSVGGNWVNNGTFTGSTSTVTFTGSATAVGGSGIQNFNNLTVGGAAITFSNASLSLSGNLATTGAGSFSQASGGTLTMTGTSKTISGSGISLDNLAVAGSVSTAASLTLTGNLSVSGSLNATAGTFTMSGASKSISGSGPIAFSTLVTGGSITSTANFGISSSLSVIGSLTATAGTATFTGTSSLNGIANLYDVTINGTSLQLAANSTLGIANIFTITAGVLNVNGTIPNTVNFNGTGAQNINAITYNKLTLSNGNTKTATGAFTVNNDFTIATGTTFAPGAFTHNLYKDWINNGTFNAGTSTVKFMGSATSNVFGATTFNILTVDNTSTNTEVVLQNNVSATTVNMTKGILLTGLNTLTITGTRTGPGYIFGTIKRTHTFSTAIPYEFEGPNNTITFASLSGVNSVTVYVNRGVVSDFPFGGAIGRVYNVTVPTGTYNATLRLHYEDDELNGNNEATMALWRYNGTTWVSSGKTSNSTTANYVEQGGLTNITNRWTTSDNANAVQWNGSVSTDWNTPNNWTVLQGSASRPPAATDIVNLGTAAFNNHPTISTAVTVKNIAFGSVQSLNLSMASGGSLITGDIQGSWSANATHSINANNQTITTSGDLVLSDGTANHIINLNIGTGTVNVGASLVQSGGAAITFTGAGKLDIHEDFNYVSGSFTPSTGTVAYSGNDNQVVGPIAYHNLTIAKSSAIATISSPLNIAGNLTISGGELDNTAVTTVTGNVTLSSGAVFQNSNKLYVGGNWSNTGSYTSAGGSIYFNGTGTQSISATTFNNVYINKPVGSSAVLTGNIGIDGDLEVISGTLDLQTFTCGRTLVGGTITGSANSTIIIGANNPPSNFASYVISPASTVIYNGTVAQDIFLPGVTLGHLIFRNSGAKTLSSSLSVAGNLTIESGSNFSAGSNTIDLTGNWLNNGSFTPGTSTMLLNGTLKTISGNTTFNKVTIAGTYTQQADVTYGDLLEITPSGSISSGTGIFTTMQGDLLNKGILNTSGTTTFSGTRLQTLSLINATTFALIVNFNGSVSPVLNSTSAPQYGYLNINNTGGINPSVGWTVNYDMTVGSGGVFNGGISTHNLLGSLTNSGTITSSGRLNFTPATAATVNVGSNFSSTGTVNFGGAGAIAIAGTPTSLYNVVINNTNAAGVTPAGNWTLANNFTINSGAIFNAGANTYNVGGNILNNGTFNRGTSTFVLNGSVTQTISSAAAFNNLTLSKPSGTANLLANATVNGALTFTSGKINTGSFNMILPALATVTGAAQNTGWVYGNLQKNIGSGAATQSYEVGDASNYTPVALVFSSVSTPGSITASTTTGDHPYLSGSSINGSKSVNRIWTLTNNGTAFNTYSATLNFKAADVDNGSSTAAFGIGIYNGSSWSMTGIASPNPTNIQATGVSTLGEFAIGEVCNAGTAISYSAPSFCINGGTVSVSQTGTGGGTYSSSTGLSLNSATGQVNLGTSTPGQYIVTYTIAATGSCSLYSTTTNITVTALPSASFNYPEASYCTNGGTAAASFTGTTGGVYSSTTGLSIDGVTGDVALGTSSPGTYTVTYTVAASGGCSVYSTTATIKVATAGTWTGIVSTDWNDAGNWICNTIPVNTTNVVIPGGLTNYPVVNVGSSPLNNLTIQAGASLTVTGATMQIGGTITNGGNFTASNGTIELNGTSAQTIPAATFVGNTVKDLTTNNLGGITLAGTLDITGVLTSSAGTFNTGGFLTLKSTASNTARVAPLPVNGSGVATSFITGAVSVERYIPNRRAWRQLTAPVSNTGNIFNSWQNAGIYENGKGTLVTGPSPNPLLNGLDASANNTVTMRTFDVSTQAFTNIVNTRTTMLSNNSGSADNIAYFMFVRGDRNSQNTNTSYSSATTLKSSGTLQTGKQVFNASPVYGKLTMLGNPYASPVDFNEVTRTHILKRFYVWDAHLNQVGGYVCLDDLDGNGIFTKSVATSTQDNHIQSGQAFFVVTDTVGAASLTWYEGSKSTSVSAAAFRLSGQSSSFNATLNLLATDGSVTLADAVLAEFHDGYSEAVNLQDAGKFSNINESISLVRNGVTLAIERRPFITANDTLFLRLAKTTARNYQFVFNMNNVDAPGLYAVLEDKFTGIATPLNIEGETTFNFNITTAAASINGDRFRIVFKQNSVLPVTYTNVTAIQKGGDIEVSWNVKDQLNIKHYEVEKSVDGVIFTKVNQQVVVAGGTASYNFTDVHAAKGNNYYRIRNVDKDGAFTYSKVVKVMVESIKSSIVVYPNPVTDGNIRLQLSGITAGKYTTRLISPLGQVVLVKDIVQTATSSSQKISLPKSLAKGMYVLNLESNGEKLHEVKVMVQ